jgi:glycolate oxidase FAD binding subunit
LINAGRLILKRQLLPVALELLSPRALACVTLENVTQKHALLIRFAGAPESVKAQIKESALIAQDDAQIVYQDQQTSDSEIWSRLAAMPYGNLDNLNFRLHVSPSEISSLLKTVEELPGDTQNELIWQAGLGDGRLRVMMKGEQLSRESFDVLLRLRRITKEKHHGSLVLEDAPDEVKESVGVWGEMHDSLPLMRRLKDQLDPEHILNPCCFDF